MLISQLIKATDISYKGEDKDIKYITDNSKKCTPDSIFVCHKKGEPYVQDALNRGAVLVVGERELCEASATTKDTRKAYALLCSHFFGDCHKSLRLIGVTGTNGKTTTCSMIHSILTFAGKSCGLITSVKNSTCDGETEATQTTPDPFILHSMLRKMKNAGAEFCVIEASSQGLFQKRLYGLKFEGAVLTNFTSDHLDYHKTLENYKNSKKILFQNSDFSVINYDDSSAQEFLDCASGEKVTYSLKSDNASYTAKCIECFERETKYVLVGDNLIHRINLKVPGKFNVSNSLGAIALCLRLGINAFECADGLRHFYSVKGRMEFVPIMKPYSVIIDYAHTEDSLRQCLLFLKSVKKGRLITVFGCGGDRDKSKRSLMGKTVCEFSDVAVVTSDNPRSEDPQDIIDDILSGMEKSKIPVYIHSSRKKAIEYALKTAKKSDIVFLAGKGHETSQQIGSQVFDFDERKIVKELTDKQN
ncbi:MAG: UDP-N-acetylmuramoyl-L-alanyl-D-glutamate--2,6-diaminopimelate ligase [Acutalibacteraceae bacterium]